jgi:rhodanese-related sulfurtransferase
MAKHPPRFLKLVEQVKQNLKETNVAEVKARLDKGEKLLLVDVREESEYAAGHIPSAKHLGKGVIERDIESAIPDTSREIILYCGGGFRSALAAENLQKMGYTNVLSMDGGWRGWTEAKLPTEGGPQASGDSFKHQGDKLGNELK